MSRYFSGAFVDSVGGVSSLSDSPLFQLILALEVYSCPSNAQSQLNCRVLICCTCYFWGSFPFFPLLHLVSSVCKSLQCLISTLTWGGESGHLFEFTCSAVLWRGKDTAKKYCWHMWGVLTVDRSHWVATAQGGMYFPGPSLSGSRCTTRA